MGLGWAVVSWIPEGRARGWAPDRGWRECPPSGGEAEAGGERGVEGLGAGARGPAQSLPLAAPAALASASPRLCGPALRPARSELLQGRSERAETGARPGGSAGGRAGNGGTLSFRRL